ncbi:MAG: 4-hydroxy-3-methylbut-2-enyl diphosphate reductase [Desulfotignum sp.]|nr:4-hydroxy-3-methylbut-2-enyl diphosphate reductase [Desulfotignum sp.]MCF8113543.1 4-hydroxy-3-methylbut-2-enyl diphosphate reductase [Desulfotignum sp.]MCF8126273.1 4-hydroxy-3-methylbut-2-enyl diphosphate reductase [Desulfotignum sp.]
MRITVAKTAGFCMGVRRAVDMVLDAANSSGEPIFTYGPLIHNPQVLEMLETKGIFRMDTIPEKGGGIVLIRAHGVPPEDEAALEKAGFTVINATCPRVVRVQVIINKYAQKGYATIIIGDKNHPEVMGLLGYARGKGHTVTAMDQLKALPRFENAVVVAQTTQNTAFYDEIKAWCAQNRPHYRLFDTICGSTERRQQEVRQLAAAHDAVIVVGGRQSGNTKRLAQVAAQSHARTNQIEDVSEIDFTALAGTRSIAITAGASTPNWIITDTCARVARHLNHQRPVAGFVSKIQEILLKTNLLLAMGAGSLTYACSVIQKLPHTLVNAAIAMLYVLSMQVLNNIFAIKSDTYNRPDRAVFYKEHRIALAALALCSGGAGLYLALTTGVVSFFILLVMSLLGLAYNLKIIPQGGGKNRIRRIKDIPGSKTILITMAWGIVTSILPAVDTSSSPAWMTAAFFYSAGLVFSRTAFFDIMAIQGDRIAGRETLPIILGEKKSFFLIQYTLVGVMALLAGAWLAGMSFSIAFLLVLVPGLMLLLIKSFEKEKQMSGLQVEFLIESSFFLTGVLVAFF